MFQIKSVQQICKICNKTSNNTFNNRNNQDKNSRNERFSVNILKYWLHFVAKSYFTSTKNKESRVIFSLTPITKYVHWFYSGKTRWLNNKHET